MREDTLARAREQFTRMASTFNAATPDGIKGLYGGDWKGYMIRLGETLGVDLCRECFKPLALGEAQINGYHNHCWTPPPMECQSCDRPIVRDGSGWSHADGVVYRHMLVPVRAVK